MKIKKKNSPSNRKISHTAKVQEEQRKRFAKPKKKIIKHKTKPIAVTVEKKEHVKPYTELEGEKDKARAELRQRAFALRYPKNCKPSERHVRPLLLIPPMDSSEIHLGFVPVIYENGDSNEIAIARPDGTRYAYWRMFFPKNYENQENKPAVPRFDSPEAAMEAWASGTPLEDDSFIRILKGEK